MRILQRQLAKATIFQTPYYIVEGRAKGNTVMVTAGVHGNETASVLAAKQLVGLLRNRSIRIDNGTLIIVPVVHRHAIGSISEGFPI